VFAGVRPDTAGGPDGAADPDTLPAVEDEPAPVPADFAHLARNVVD
jgi:hypothetical protein